MRRWNKYNDSAMCSERASSSSSSEDEMHDQQDEYVADEWVRTARRLHEEARSCSPAGLSGKSPNIGQLTATPSSRPPSRLARC